jgi:ATP-dependent RNA helicase DeaD
MDLFKRKELQVLIATDIAARGIDVNDLTHVFHVSLPDDLSYYTHRSGRTARAGKKGISLAIINVHEKEKLHRISRSLDIKFQQVLVPQTKEVYSLKVENWCRGILEKPGKNKVEPKILEKALLLLGNLSKEELVAKLLTTEIDKWNVGATVDLNFDFSKPAGGKSPSYPKSSQPKKTFNSGKRSFSKKKSFGKRPVG